MSLHKEWLKTKLEDIIWEVENDEILPFEAAEAIITLFKEAGYEQVTVNNTDRETDTPHRVELCLHYPKGGTEKA